MIIYIHGFGGSGAGSKAKIFKELFKAENRDFIAPSLSYIPELAISTLKELIESYRGDIYLIGSSLGGYYATYLSKLPKVKRVVLLNPSTQPEKSLKRFLGLGVTFYDESRFEWNVNHIESLKRFKVNSFDRDKFLVVLQSDDELIDYRVAKEMFKDVNMIVASGGGHSFTGVENYFDEINHFFS
jgi:predicted esterase YcpF (UPF0227 family)